MDVDIRSVHVDADADEIVFNIRIHKMRISKNRYPHHVFTNRIRAVIAIRDMIFCYLKTQL
jgi:hypothetical protein